MKTEHCLIYDLKADRCKECEEGYIILYHACVVKIDNCMNNFVYNNDGDIRCLSCNDGFYLNDNKCIKGSIPNCR